VASVRPGGVVTYATCSPLLPETTEVVSAVLDGRPAVEVVPCGGLLPSLGAADGPLPGSVQLWPHRHGTDAMFVTVLRRRD
jgi:16S rRNA (cytosine967-C5)-methyltransferase